MTDGRSTEPQEWLHYAREDLLAAEAALPGGLMAPRHACFFAQQATEKVLKAALIACGIIPPRVHALETLRVLLPADWPGKEDLPDMTALTQWSAGGRYPDLPHATAQDALVAVQIARSVFDLIVEGFELREVPTDQ